MPTFNNLFSVSFISHSLPNGPVADCHIMWPTHAIQGVMRNHYCRKLFALYYDMQYGYFHPIKFIALGSTKNQVKFIYYSMSLFFTLFLSSTMAKAPGRQQRARELYRRWGNSSSYPAVRWWCKEIRHAALGQGSLCEFDQPLCCRHADSVAL